MDPKFLKIASTIQLNIFMTFVTYLMFNHDVPLLRFYFTISGFVFYSIIKVISSYRCFGVGVLVGKFAIFLFLTEEL